jgi:uncharacterized DUF497 family protein
MKHFLWNFEKNEQLIRELGISFERILFHIEKKDILDIVSHPNTEKYPNQRMFIINIDNYAYLVPFVENDTEIFLKTIIPSRKATRRYIEVNDD